MVIVIINIYNTVCIQKIGWGSDGLLFIKIEDK